MPEKSQWVRSVTNELTNRVFKHQIGCSDKTIPEDAFFGHVIPFYSFTPGSSEILSYLKADKSFSDGKTESEMAIFAWILKELINYEGRYRPRITIPGTSFFSNYVVAIDFEHCQNLEDILAGKFTVSLDRYTHDFASNFLFASFVSLTPLIIAIVFFQLNAFDSQTKNMAGVLFLLMFFLPTAAAACRYAYRAHCYSMLKNEQGLLNRHFDTQDLMHFADKYSDTLVKVETKEVQHADRQEDVESLLRFDDSALNYRSVP